MICTRCNNDKSDEDFWYCKKREKYQTPCKDCRNRQKRAKRKIDYVNGNISTSNYRLSGYPQSLTEVIKNSLILNRQLKRMDGDFLVTADRDIAIVYCSRCGISRSMKMPCGISELQNLVELTKEIHDDKRCKRQMALPQE